MKITLQTGHVSLGAIVLRGIRLPESYEPPDDPPAVGDVNPVRRMYRAIRLDPTRNRPSSEALLRRLKKGLGLPRVNALVDVVNVESVRRKRPFGLYDLDHVRGDLVLRTGEEGEGYEGIGKPWVNLSGHYALLDDEGPIGNPSSDSHRTRIRAGTTNALVLVYGPKDDAHADLAALAARLTAAVGGTAETSVVR